MNIEKASGAQRDALMQELYNQTVILQSMLDLLKRIEEQTELIKKKVAYLAPNDQSKDPSTAAAHKPAALSATPDPVPTSELLAPRPPSPEPDQE